MSTVEAGRAGASGRALSLAIGEDEPPLLEETIGASFERAVRRYADQEALVEVASGRRWTWSELDADVNALARGLLAAGLEKGDRVGIWAPNCAEWTLTQYATAKTGVILVNVNPAYRTHELAYAVNQSGLRLLVAASRFKSSDYTAMVAETRDECPALERVVFLDTDDWAELLAEGREMPTTAVAERMAELGPSDPINIQYTSGTTGRPKGATLSHRNILNNGYFTTELIHLGPEDRLCIPVPFYHCFGMVMANLGCTSHGTTMVIPAPGFDPETTLATIAAEKCTGVYGVPTMFIAMQNHPTFADHDLSSLRTGIMAGSICPVEFCTRGDSVVLGYWNDDEKTREAVDADGWMHTGDLAEMRDDGYCNIVGRIKDMVIRGGENIYPHEIEDFLYTHPDIEDVQVVGVPDQRYGEELCAWIKVRAGAAPLDAEAARAFCGGKLAHYKIPRYVMLVDGFPMTVTGKIRKVEMREKTTAELGLDG